MLFNLRGLKGLARSITRGRIEQNAGREQTELKRNGHCRLHQQVLYEVSAAT
ncbi:MAG: hypothetical protein AAFY72_07245 [Cyanobacteria bacterium J06649_4]